MAMCGASSYKRVHSLVSAIAVTSQLRCGIIDMLYRTASSFFSYTSTEVR